MGEFGMTEIKARVPRWLSDATADRYRSDDGNVLTIQVASHRLSVNSTATGWHVKLDGREGHAETLAELVDWLAGAGPAFIQELERIAADLVPDPPADGANQDSPHDRAAGNDDDRSPTDSSPGDVELDESDEEESDDDDELDESDDDFLDGTIEVWPEPDEETVRRPRWFFDVGTGLSRGFAADLLWWTAETEFAPRINAVAFPGVFGDAPSCEDEEEWDWVSTHSWELVGGGSMTGDYGSVVSVRLGSRVQTHDPDFPSDDAQSWEGPGMVGYAEIPYESTKTVISRPGYPDIGWGWAEDLEWEQVPLDHDWVRSHVDDGGDACLEHYLDWCDGRQRTSRAVAAWTGTSTTDGNIYAVILQFEPMQLTSQDTSHVEEGEDTVLEFAGFARDELGNDSLSLTPEWPAYFGFEGLQEWAWEAANGEYR